MAVSSADCEAHRLELAALVFFEIVRQALVLSQAAKAGALDGADVDERIVAAGIIRLDEAITFVFVVKFHGAGWHVVFLLFRARNIAGLLWLGVHREGERSRKSAQKPSICD